MKDSKFQIPNSFIKKTAFFFSVVLHPLVMPTIVFATILYSYLYQNFSAKEQFIFYTLLYTFLLPGFVMLVLKKLKLIPSIRMERREERRIPMLVTAGLYLLGTGYLAINFSNYPLLYIILLMIAISIIIVTIITEFWKISAHATGIGGWLGVCLFLFQKSPITFNTQLFYIATLLTVVLLISRFVLKAHTVSQLIAGLLLGISVSYFSAISFST